MKWEKKIQDEYVDHRFGFPVILQNVGVVKIRGEWCPDVNADILRRLVLLSLIVRKGFLTGHEVRYIRRWMKETLEEFSQRFGVSHAAIKKWEDKGENPTGTGWSNDFCIRLMVFEKLIEDAIELHNMLEEFESHPLIEKIKDLLVWSESDGDFRFQPHFRRALYERISHVPEQTEPISLDFAPNQSRRKIRAAG